MMMMDDNDGRQSRSMRRRATWDGRGQQWTMMMAMTMEDDDKMKMKMMMMMMDD